MYRERVASGALACCDVIVLLDPGRDVARRQREGDPLRTRRNFERNLQVATLMRPMWDALRPLFVSRLMVVGDGAGFALPEMAALPERARMSKSMQVLDIISSRF